MSFFFEKKIKSYAVISISCIGKNEGGVKMNRLKNLAIMLRLKEISNELRLACENLAMEDVECLMEEQYDLEMQMI